LIALTIEARSMNGLVDYVRRVVRPANRSTPLPPPGTVSAVRRSAALRFRDYEASDRPAIIELLARGRPASYQRLKEAVFDWQFLENPHDDGSPPYIIGTLDGEIVAVNGFMPVAIRYQDAQRRACWSCDVYVAPELRGSGLGKKLLRIASERAAVMLAYGISDMSDPIFAREGWALHPATRTLFFHACEPGFVGTLKDACSLAEKRIERLRHGLPRLDVTCHDEDFGDDVDELWQRTARGYTSTVHRNAAYLNWKYRRHPFERYEWYSVRSGSRLLALIVARHSAKTSVLVDYVGPAGDVELMSGLVAAVTADLTERGTVRVKCETTHAPLFAALRRSGYIGSRWSSRFRVRTNLLGDDQPMPGWFLMGGDSDGDTINHDSEAARAFRWPPAVTAYIAPVT
jgi:GNAT superfamily N-acetyltransferase